MAIQHLGAGSPAGNASTSNFNVAGLLYCATVGALPTAATGPQVAGVLAGADVAFKSVTTNQLSSASDNPLVLNGTSDYQVPAVQITGLPNTGYTASAIGLYTFVGGSDAIFVIRAYPRAQVYSSNAALAWCNSQDPGGASDVGLSRSAAGTLALGNGTLGDASGSFKCATANFNNLPTADPHVAGSLWRNENTVMISTG